MAVLTTPLHDWGDVIGVGHLTPVRLSGRLLGGEPDEDQRKHRHDNGYDEYAGRSGAACPLATTAVHGPSFLSVGSRI